MLRSGVPGRTTIFRTFLFSATLFLSAGLMFMVQPLIGKMMLPFVGGAPSGWLVAMAFFQIILLAGYGLAHLLSHLPVRIHVVAVCALLATSLVMLPVQFRMDADFPDAPHVLLALFAAISLPFFALSAVGSSLQRLFASAENNADPYFLFAASNLGSFCGLLLYPLWAERAYGLIAQATGWRWGYAALIEACALCLFAAYGTKNTTMEIAPAPAIGWKQRLRWVCLALIPSSLMLGTTSYIAVEAGSIPYLWVIPLALYLLTFVLAFAKTPLISLNTLACLQPLTLALAVFVFVEKPFVVVMGQDALYVAVIAFFFTALLCHFILAAERPPAARLTEYYLWIALGGAIGGSFNAFAVPFLFPLPVEFIVVALAAAWLYPGFARKISLVTTVAVAATFIATFFWGRQNAHTQLAEPPGALDLFALGMAICYLVFYFVRGGAALRLPPVMRLSAYIVGFMGLAAIAVYLFVTQHTALPFLLFSLAILAFWPKALAIAAPFLGLLSFLLQTAPSLVTAERNFFGVWRIYDMPVGDQTVRVLLHGSTLHDMQPSAPVLDTAPHAYYDKRGPLGDVFAVLNPTNVGVIGLGAGAIVCYDAPNRHYRFYEIDRDVAVLAARYFGYFHACGAPDIVIGDGRKSLAAAKDARYDLLIIDAFTSDMIPLHLLTKEAFETYLAHLAPKGVIALHISSRYYDLRQPLSGVVQALGLKGIYIFAAKPRRDRNNPDVSPFVFASHWVLIAREDATLAQFRAKGWQDLPPPHLRLWTDDYSDALSVLDVKKLSAKMGAGGTQ